MCGRTNFRCVLVGSLMVALRLPIGAQLPAGQTTIPLSPPEIDPPMAGKLAGTWYRQCEGAIVAATFAENELKVRVTFNADCNTIRLDLTANYAVTKDGQVHGNITGMNCDVNPKPKAATLALAREALASAGFSVETLHNCRFSFQTKSTSTGLLVSNLSTTGHKDSEFTLKVLDLFDGIYSYSKDGEFATKHLEQKRLAGTGNACEERKAKLSNLDVVRFTAQTSGFGSNRVRITQKNPDSVTLAILENTDVFPFYYRNAADDLAKRELGPCVAVAESEVFVNGSMCTREYRITYLKKLALPIPTKIPLANP